MGSTSRHVPGKHNGQDCHCYKGSIGGEGTFCLLTKCPFPIGVRELIAPPVFLLVHLHASRCRGHVGEDAPHATLCPQGFLGGGCRILSPSPSPLSQPTFLALCPPLCPSSFQPPLLPFTCTAFSVWLPLVSWRSLCSASPFPPRFPLHAQQPPIWVVFCFCTSIRWWSSITELSWLLLCHGPWPSLKKVVYPFVSDVGWGRALEPYDPGGEQLSLSPCYFCFSVLEGHLLL